MTAESNPESQWFGYNRVNPEDKTGLVRGVFDSVAERYDVMNDAMSLGIHRVWKSVFVRRAAPQAGEVIIDLAGGTGDIAFRMHKKTTGRADITICDINAEMLMVGRNRAFDKGFGADIGFTCGNAESLPFPDNHADLITIAYGLRNVAHIDHALAEITRVLKPGGRFFCLEFSHVDNPALARAYDLYSFSILPRLGQIIADDADSYQYLAESIRQFPKREDLVKRMSEAGLVNCTAKTLSHGITAIHSGVKGSY